MNRPESLQKPHIEHSYSDFELQELSERMSALYEPLTTKQDELKQLYEDSKKDAGKLELFTDLLDDIAYKALEKNDTFTQNITAMRKASPDEQIRIRDDQRAMFNDVKTMILREAGIRDFEDERDLEVAKAKIREKIQPLLDNSSVSEANILEALEVLVVDESGDKIFHYPDGLFPKATTEKWNNYLAAVRQHLRTKRNVDTGVGDRKDEEQDDAMRRIAHNAVSEDINELLGLSGLPDAEWDFEKTRKLVAKMRDERYPTIETAEREVTEKAILDGIFGKQVVSVLEGLNERVHTLNKK